MAMACSKFKWLCELGLVGRPKIVPRPALKCFSDQCELEKASELRECETESATCEREYVCDCL